MPRPTPSRTVTPQRRAEVRVSELIGSIAGARGAAAPRRFGPLDDATTARLTVQRAGEIDGLRWIRLDTGGGAPIVDSLRQRTSWIPAYLPLFDTAVEVRPGD